MLSFDPPIGHVGDAVTVSVNASQVSGLAKADVYVYGTPNALPTSEEGWFKLGSISGSTGQLSWSTGGWQPGKYYLTVIGYDASGKMLANPFENVAVKSPLEPYSLSDAQHVKGTTGAPPTATPPAFGFTDMFKHFFEADPVPAIAVAGIATILVFKLLSKD